MVLSLSWSALIKGFAHATSRRLSGNYLLPHTHHHTAHKSSTQKREHQITKEPSTNLHSLFELEREALGTCRYSCVHCSFTVCYHFVRLLFTNCIKELNSLCWRHESEKKCMKTLSVSPPLSNTTTVLSNGGVSRVLYITYGAGRKNNIPYQELSPVLRYVNSYKQSTLCTKLNMS